MGLLLIVPEGIVLSKIHAEKLGIPFARLESCTSILRLVFPPTSHTERNRMPTITALQAKTSTLVQLYSYIDKRQFLRIGE